MQYIIPKTKKYYIINKIIYGSLYFTKYNESLH